jgi:hypothetical protein
VGRVAVPAGRQARLQLLQGFPGLAHGKGDQYS